MYALMSGVPVRIYLLFRATPIDCFVDYIRGGCQINLMVAIDFTVSDNLITTPTLGPVQVLWCI